MRAILCVSLCVVAIVAGAGVITSCCGSAASGDICVIPQPDDGGVYAYSPALECTSHICVIGHRAAGVSAVCTRECASSSDCDSMRVFCHEGYGCGTVAGYPRPICVCSVFLDGGTP